jgi:hypothetical protein
MILATLLQLAVTVAPIDSIGANPLPVSDSAHLSTSWTLTQKVDSQRVRIVESGITTWTKRLSATTRSLRWWVQTSSTKPGPGTWRICITAYRRGREAQGCKARYFTNPLAGSWKVMAADTTVLTNHTLQYCTFMKWVNGAHVHAANNPRPACDSLMGRYIKEKP